MLDRQAGHGLFSPGLLRSGRRLLFQTGQALPGVHVHIFRQTRQHGLFDPVHRFPVLAGERQAAAEQKGRLRKERVTGRQFTQRDPGDVQAVLCQQVDRLVVGCDGLIHFARRRKQRHIVRG